MAVNDAIDWKPGDPTYTSPYARDFGSTPSGFDRRMLRRRGFNFDFGEFGDMDDDSRHLAMIGRGGSTGSSSIGSGGGNWLGRGSVDIPGAKGFDSGGREANFSTLNKITGSIPRAIKRGIKAFNTLAGAGQANKLADLADQKQQVLSTIAGNQQKTKAVQDQYKDSYLGGAFDPYSQAYNQAASAGSTSTYDKTRPRAGAGGAAKAAPKATKAPTTQKPVKPTVPKGPKAPKGPKGPKGPQTNKPTKPTKPTK